MIKILFFHGLLGDKSDWQKILTELKQIAPNVQCQGVDLPLHGEAKHLVIQNFAQCRAYLNEQIQAFSQNCSKLYLVGYSLGGRVLTDWFFQQDSLSSNLKGIILESSNFGLQTKAEKIARIRHDQIWAKKFLNLPIEEVLDEWYQQNVFAHLNAEERHALIAKRSHNLGSNIAQMLEATGLAKQENYYAPFWRAKLLDLEKYLDFRFICGAKDLKYQKIAQAIGFQTEIIPDAGHNCHQEQPQIFAKKINEIVNNNRVKLSYKT